ncbi:hypothetical protein [Xenorhabdus innexi]|uniref:Lipoprotein n=1 Tax=Xenorhabdus innexi TaxID=290109 RepID=A0A1N6MR14_9GAMM|nr:hypothetical protein [Xenorhabdus innexi]PHM30056.1 hypothetical protein Xinn_03574 [Xenorhabdus innexi]SIP71214.1 conserved exported hypothetical protein [Xenorhabdus innexi]
MMKKILLAFMLSLFSFVSFADDATIFETKTYHIAIYNLCPEGYVSCEDVKSVVKNKKKHTSLIMKGSTMNRDCDTGSCSFYGYKFKSKGITYTIYQQGILYISKDKKVLFSEEGTFRY